jgi:hypothetical protein
VNALIDLLNVQNDFLSVWVDHEVQTLQLDHDLGIMELDANGLRISHRAPLQSFLENLPPTAPACELPNVCDLPSEPAQPAQPEVSQSINFQPALIPAGPQLAPTPSPADGARLRHVLPPQMPAAGAGVVPAMGTVEGENRATQADFRGVESEGGLVPRRLPAVGPVEL